MTSGDLDSYLGLFEAGGLFLAEDDNSGGGRNARIVREVPAGKYRIWANTITGNATGAYSLTVAQR
jgi:serine protease Do